MASQKLCLKRKRVVKVAYLEILKVCDASPQSSAQGSIEQPYIHSLQTPSDEFLGPFSLNGRAVWHFQPSAELLLVRRFSELTAFQVIWSEKYAKMRCMLPPKSKQTL